MYFPHRARSNIHWAELEIAHARRPHDGYRSSIALSRWSQLERYQSGLLRRIDASGLPSQRDQTTLELFCDEPVPVAGDDRDGKAAGPIRHKARANITPRLRVELDSDSHADRGDPSSATTTTSSFTIESAGGRTRSPAVDPPPGDTLTNDGDPQETRDSKTLNFSRNCSLLRQPSSADHDPVDFANRLNVLERIPPEQQKIG